MRKKILLILPLLLFAITQQLQAVTCNWGYCNSVVNDQFGSVNKGKGAIYIPAEISKMYEGKQLSYVRVAWLPRPRPSRSSSPRTSMASISPPAPSATS